MTHDGNESDPPAYSASRATALMPRDELLGLVNATAAASVSAHAVPRVILEQRTANAERDLRDATSSLPVLGIITVLVALFAAIMLSAH